MPGRRRAREYALQALYAVDMGGMTAESALEGLWQMGIESDDPIVSSEELAFAEMLVKGVRDEVAGLDAAVEAASTNWRVSRMPMVDRNILRIGALELTRRKDIPPSVSINEAVELAKRFGASESRAFVNGLLDRIAGDSGRGGRRPAPTGQKEPQRERAPLRDEPPRRKG